MTKDEILAAVRDYNSRLGADDDRLVATMHHALCRCHDCWYNYGSRERNATAKCHQWEQVGSCMNGPNPWRCRKCGNTTRSHVKPPTDHQHYVDLDTGEVYR